jgi:hypothetical protein
VPGKKNPGHHGPGLLYDLSSLGFDDLAALDAAGADAQFLRAALNLGLHRAKIDAPAPPRHIVRMRDIVSELRAFAADLTDLSHDKTPNPELFVQTRPVEFSSLQVAVGRKNSGG